jgi:hypothetical protein
MIQLVRCMVFTCAFSALCAVGSASCAAQLESEQDESGVNVTVDGELFARYVFKSGAKPIIWPIYGPTGKDMTRGYPMRDATAAEKEDHIHHRSFWFTHGDVNGISFWHEEGEHGNIVQHDISVRENKGNIAISTQNDWMGPKGKKQCEDSRTFTFSANEKQRWIDAEITVTASEGPVEFGDTKEGCFGVRVAGSMRTELENGGTIVNSEGETNEEAWGKAASWVDYFGPVDGETVGIAILNHPSSFRFPTYWHVRTYGLFTANPFGLHNFKGDAYDGSYSMKKGDSFILRHRVLFHSGDDKQAGIAEAYKAYAAQRIK